MKTPTGHSCRVDDMGRITIPKEVRHQLRIHAGNVMNIFIDPETNEVIFATDHPWETKYYNEVTLMIYALRRQFPELEIDAYQGYGEYYNPLVRGYLDSEINDRNKAIKKVLDEATMEKHPIYNENAGIVAVPVICDVSDPTKGAFLGITRQPCSSDDNVICKFIAAAQTTAGYLKLLEEII